MVWVPLLACPAVFSVLALLDKPAVAPASKSVITFDNSYGHPSRSWAVPKDQKKKRPSFSRVLDAPWLQVRPQCEHWFTVPNKSL
jgi:hypothetical protein